MLTQHESSTRPKHGQRLSMEICACCVQDEEPQASGSQGVQDSEGNEWQEHDLAAFAGLKVSEASSSAKGEPTPTPAAHVPIYDS